MHHCAMLLAHMPLFRSCLASMLLALPVATSAQPPADLKPLKPVTVARGLVNPWSLAFLPDGRIFLFFHFIPLLTLLSFSV